jgi:hypothetical protein
MNRDSSGGVAMGYGFGRPGLILGRSKRFCLFHSVQTVSGAKTGSYLMDTGALSSGMKRPGREADNCM